MIGFPVIYTRTFYEDFQFCVLPDFVDSKVLINYINVSTRNLCHTMNYHGVKIIYANESYCVIGFTCHSKQLADIDSTIQEYTHDENGRSLYGFWGVAIKKDSFDSIPMINDEIWTRMFKKYIIPIWKEISPELISPEPLILNTAPYNETSEREYEAIDDKYYFINETDHFEWILYRVLCLGEEISYCSLLKDYFSVKISIFTYTVTNNECYLRLKKEHDEKMAAEQLRATYYDSERKAEGKISLFQKIFHRRK